MVRTFETGATRDSDVDKLDYEGFLCPLVLERYALYLHKHRQTANGFRASDNWQNGIPLDVYMKSAWRHFHAVWKNHRSNKKCDVTEDIAALLFNMMGYMHELLKQHKHVEGHLRLDLEDGYPHG